MLGVVPAYQASVGPALNELCLGLQANDVANVFLLTLYCESKISNSRELYFIFVCRLSMEYIQKMFMSEWPA